MVYSIRWQDPALWPGMLRLVPPGHAAVTEAAAARPLIQPHIHAAGLPPWRAKLFDMLWNAALEQGMQPSGLVLLRLDDLREAVGHKTTGTVRRWAQFCHRRSLWVHVPGKLTPSPSPGSGTRMRAYLVVRPDLEVVGSAASARPPWQRPHVSPAEQRGRQRRQLT